MTHAPVLVTGGSGFVGPYLIAALERQGKRVVALGDGPETPAGAGFPPAITPEWVPIDIRDHAALAALVARVNPVETYHLAALSSVASSFEDPSPTYEVNVMGTLHLLDALRRHAPACRTLVVSSAEVYGGLRSPLSEEMPLAPGNPYAASKAAAEMIAIEHFRAHGLPIIRARAFNHTGPGQSPRFVVSAFARQIAQIEVGRQAPSMGVGNLEARRDFLDVRDVVAAYVVLGEHGSAGAVYNVCSGRAAAMRELLDGLLAQAKVGIEVFSDAALMRPLDVPELVGDNRLLREATGWAPRVPLEETLADVLAYWRACTPMLGDAITQMA